MYVCACVCLCVRPATHPLIRVFLWCNVDAHGPSQGPLGPGPRTVPEGVRPGAAPARPWPGARRGPPSSKHPDKECQRRPGTAESGASSVPHPLAWSGSARVLRGPSGGGQA